MYLWLHNLFLSMLKKKILISLEAVEKVFLYEGTYVWVGHVISSLEPIAQNDI